MSAAPYPVHVDARLDERLSRGLWLVKWLMIIPHFIVLFFLWMAFVVLTIVAFFAILFTGRYPRGIFDFNVGVMRWGWRVSYYSYGALGTDRYPPFTLSDVPDYPAHFDVEYPQRLSRGLVLVKWWLLAIPHYIVLAIFVGGVVGWTEQVTDSVSWQATIPGLIGFLVFVAAVVLLFTGSYPRHIFDFVMGMQRWVLRVTAYASLMTDDYPPFRLDSGGPDPDADRVAVTAPPAGAEGAAAPGTGWTPGWVATAVVGSVFLLGSLGMGAGAGVLAFADQGLRDDQGFLMSGEQDFVTSSYAISSENIELHTAQAAESVPRRLLGDVKVEVTAPQGTNVFVGIARTADAASYLSGVSHATLTDITSRGNPVYSETLGGAPGVAPEQAGIWAEQVSGSGTVDLVWTPESGDWTIVVMNADASEGVFVTASAGAELPALTAVWVTMLVLAGIGFVVGLVLLVVPLVRVSGQR